MAHVPNLVYRFGPIWERDIFNLHRSGVVPDNYPDNPAEFVVLDERPIPEEVQE